MVRLEYEPPGFAHSCSDAAYPISAKKRRGVQGVIEESNTAEYCHQKTAHPDSERQDSLLHLEHKEHGIAIERQSPVPRHSDGRDAHAKHQGRGRAARMERVRARMQSGAGRVVQRSTPAPVRGNFTWYSLIDCLCGPGAPPDRHPPTDAEYPVPTAPQGPSAQCPQHAEPARVGRSQAVF